MSTNPLPILPMSPTDSLAQQRATMPCGTQTILNSRTVATAHQRLAAWLQPGLTVLDVGCGTGAITCGIAEAVTPSGRVLGMDIHPGLVGETVRTHHGVPGLFFAVADVYHLPCQAAFQVILPCIHGAFMVYSWR